MPGVVDDLRIELAQRVIVLGRCDGCADDGGLEAGLQAGFLHRLFDGLLQLPRVADRVAHLELELHLLGDVAVGRRRRQRCAGPTSRRTRA